MTATAYVDPGVHRCGVAWFVNRALVKAQWRLVERPLQTRPLCFESAECCVVELPQVYPGSRVRTADLIDLAYAAGRMCGNVPTHTVYPRQWKGQLKCTCTAKTRPEQCTHHRRMIAALTSGELEIVRAADCPPGQLHNVYDAVTMGLKFEGRL